MNKFTPLTIIMDARGKFEHLQKKGFKNADWNAIGMIPEGTEGGNDAVVIELTLEDGTTVLAYSTWRLVHAAVNGLAAKYGIPD